MSVQVSTVERVSHPWREVGAMPDVRVIFAELPPGLLGLCDHDKRTIWLTTGMSQRQRRAVLKHELVHLKRGRVFSHFVKQEERAVEVATAHALIPLPSLIDALRWTQDVHELADELWAPADLIVVRMNHLHPAESRRIRQELSDLHETMTP